MIMPSFSLRNLFYLCYGLVLLSVLLYVRFPTEKFRMYCERQIEHYLQFENCSIKKIRYRFPFGATLDQIRLENSAADNKSSMLVAELSLQTDVKGFGKNFSMDGNFYGGNFRSSLQIDYGAEEFLLNNITASGVQLEQLAESLNLAERKNTGTITFAGNYSAPFFHPSVGRGDGNVQIIDGTFQLAQPILGLPEIAYQKMQFQLKQDRESVELENGKLESEHLTADFSGDIVLGELRADSVLNLQGTMEPDQKLLNRDPAMQRYIKRLARR